MSTVDDVGPRHPIVRPGAKGPDDGPLSKHVSGTVSNRIGHTSPQHLISAPRCLPLHACNGSFSSGSTRSDHAVNSGSERSRTSAGSDTGARSPRARSAPSDRCCTHCGPRQSQAPRPAPGPITAPTPTRTSSTAAARRRHTTQVRTGPGGPAGSVRRNPQHRRRRRRLPTEPRRPLPRARPRRRRWRPRRALPLLHRLRPQRSRR